MPAAQPPSTVTAAWLSEAWLPGLRLCRSRLSAAASLSALRRAGRQRAAGAAGREGGASAQSPLCTSAACRQREAHRTSRRSAVPFPPAVEPVPMPFTSHPLRSTHPPTHPPLSVPHGAVHHLIHGQQREGILHLCRGRQAGRQAGWVGGCTGARLQGGGRAARPPCWQLPRAAAAAGGTHPLRLCVCARTGAVGAPKHAASAPSAAYNGGAASCQPPPAWRSRPQTAAAEPRRTWPQGQTSSRWSRRRRGSASAGAGRAGAGWGGVHVTESTCA